ncbi:LysR substrate-binding domain-containing protein [Glutamicibacter sp. MNS18]|uniref:LysR substrate-binding domain-containing protein n=1 Tax=Glutamicibacter sp. MNS18 TaxID=2989817 RepID=UPI002235A533|nr:LysR substrate-binding domain-containing protein [Glutamicibacter sp. MNS18]MCW4466047.1 LysR substrate-binding domain-containing protein [Glutamicibacter sp. MNS18]
MDTRHLRYFVAVAEERHFGRAALRLHMAQPPLSQQIKQLEDQLGTQLLIRTTRKVELTAAGELLLTRARALLEEHEQLARDVRTVGEGASGVLRLGSTGSATYRIMPRIIEATTRQMPGMQLNVQGEMLTPQMEEALVEGRLDVAILRPPVRSDQVDYVLMEQDKLSVALPADHPLAQLDTVHIDQLVELDFVCYPQSSAVTTITFEACRRAGFTPRVAQVARETSTLLTFVAAGLGIGLVPTTNYLPHSGRIAFRPLANAPAVDLAMAWKSGNDSALVRNFLDLCAPPLTKEGP